MADRYQIALGEFSEEEINASEESRTIDLMPKIKASEESRTIDLMSIKRQSVWPTSRDVLNGMSGTLTISYYNK